MSGPIYSPAYDLNSIPTDSLKLSCLVPHVQARDLLVIREEKNHCAVPRKVRTLDGTVRFFKPCLAGMETDFIREISALSRIIEAGLNRKIRVSSLVGLVVADEGTTAIGLLLEWIQGSTLGDPFYTNARAHHAKWKKQVMEIIGALHAHSILWGDMNPHNIIVDKAFDAWVVDFGGRCNTQFIDEENAETETGDWQGFHRLFDERLVERGIGNEAE